MPKLLIMKIKNKFNMRKFYLKNGLRKELEIKFKCSRQTVYNALNYKTSSAIAKSIRDYAVNNLGAKRMRVR